MFRDQLHGTLTGLIIKVSLSFYVLSSRVISDIERGGGGLGQGEGGGVI